MLRNVEYDGKADRRNFLKLVSVASAATGILSFANTASVAETHATAAAPRTQKTWQTAATLRDLWIHHIFWIRNVCLATFNKNDPAMKAAEQQVVANSQSIAATMEPFYGAAAKESFFKLLAGHYGAVRTYLVATADNDASAQGTATQSITSNAEEIADFLSKANPYLPKDAVYGFLLAHGGHHIEQIQELHGRKYDSEAKTWADMKDHIYEIADATADALAKQFPKTFS
jgi:hypothetical protein